MGCEFHQYKVSEFAKVVGGGTPKTKVSRYWNGSIPWLTPKDLSNHQERFVSRGARSISHEGLQNSSARMIPKGTVLLTSRAPVGYVAIAKNEICTNQGFRNIILKDGFSPEFTYYLLVQNVDYLKQHASGSTFQELSGSALKNLTFKIPPYPEQRAIAHILGSLDDKIELNRRMNKTLEAMAQALFKSWFVDFDPVIDNALAAGKPIPEELKEKACLRATHRQAEIRRALGDTRKPLPDEIQKLFPAEFEYTEDMGWIPKGWRVGKVSDLGKVICGKTPPTNDPENYGTEVPFITIPDMHGNVYVTHTGKILSRKGANTQKKKYLPPNSICVSCIATPGLVVLNSEESQTNQQINSVIPHDIKTAFFCYEILSQLGEYIRNAGSGGSVFSNLSKGRFEELKIVLPASTLKLSFNGQVKIFFEKILGNQKHIEILSNLRDTLLPKLLSGEIRIPEADKLVEDLNRNGGGNGKS